MVFAVLAGGLLWSSSAHADAAAAGDAATAPGDNAAWSLHFQSTGVWQGYPGFHSPFQGQNSLPGGGGGARDAERHRLSRPQAAWQGGGLYFNPEAQQGFGIGRTVGIAGFPNGEGGKAGFDTPKPNVARLFLRQTFGLGGATEMIEDGANRLATIAGRPGSPSISSRR